MADLKISQLTAITTLTPATDVLPVVDSGGVTKKITTNQILGSGGTATLASATISGALDAARLNVTGATIPANGVYLGSANKLSFSAASTLGMTLDATGLGVGVASPLYKLHTVVTSGAVGAFRASTAAIARLLVGNTVEDVELKVNANGDGQLTANASKYLGLGSGGINDRVILDTSGNLLVGVTSALFNSRLRVKTSSTSASDYGVYVADSADALIFALRNDGLIYTGTKTASPYNNTTGSAANAFIAADGTLGRSTSSLKYKTDITDSTRGLADVLKLRPVTYKSKNGDDTIFGGLIAEEVHAAGLTEFVAYAPDNAPDAIHYSNMVSLLVAAIKELTARVQTLEAK